MDEAYADLNNGGKKFPFKNVLANGVAGYELCTALQAKLAGTASQLVTQALFNCKLAFYALYKPVKEKADASRDESMAQMIKLLMDQQPNTRMIVWAHSAHVARGKIFTGDSNGGGTGEFVESWFPGQYYVTGTGTSGGTVSVTTDHFILNSSRFKQTALPAAIDSSWKKQWVLQVIIYFLILLPINKHHQNGRCVLPGIASHL